MTTTLPSPPKDRPWDKYRKESRAQGQDRLLWKLLIPGWADQLYDSELEFIQAKLQADPVLSYWWGFRPGTKRRPIEAIKAVAMWGDPEVRSVNVRLARKHRILAATQMALPWG
jgi:hypothetical protein